MEDRSRHRVRHLVPDLREHGKHSADSVSVCAAERDEALHRESVARRHSKKCLRSLCLLARATEQAGTKVLKLGLLNAVGSNCAMPLSLPALHCLGELLALHEVD